MNTKKSFEALPRLKEQYPDFPLKNGGVAGAIELKRPVGAHCHGARGWCVGESADKMLAKKKLYIASAVCLVFMIGEEVTGPQPGHHDGRRPPPHDFGSMMGVCSPVDLVQTAHKTMNFGWHDQRSSGVHLRHVHLDRHGALVYLAIERIVRNDYEIEGHVMLVTSGCAVIVNIIMAYILHHSTTFHAHGSGYHHIDEDGQSPAPTATATRPRRPRQHQRPRAFIHVMGDLLQSVGVRVAAIASTFGALKLDVWGKHHLIPPPTPPPHPPLYIQVADPICTFLFSVFVLCTTVTILRDVFRILMEGSPKGIEFNSVKEVLLSVKAVKSMHSLHLWALTLRKEPTLSLCCRRPQDLLHTKFGFYSITIQVELYSEDMSHCSTARTPVNETGADTGRTGLDWTATGHGTARHILILSG
ncbi:hypothetical protein INR49_004137 [Caranx melampygus]|nr:hypothetical protein INR49_004137 [Caranx melampygus]